jgi:hypothetical protein
MPSSKPSFHIILSANALLALEKKVSITTLAIANLAATNVATTPFLPNSNFSDSRLSKACFIQMKVAPQTKVTASSAYIALRLWSDDTFRARKSASVEVVVFSPMIGGSKFTA